MTQEEDFQNAVSATNRSTVVSMALHGLSFVVFACIGFVVNMAFEDIKDNREKHDNAPHVFVLKDDYREDQLALLSELKSLRLAIQHQGEKIEADYNRRMDKMEVNLTDLIRKTAGGP